VTTGQSTSTLLRAHDAEDTQRVTFIELFFDLVYAFAVTQLSHLLLGHVNVLGAAQTLLLLLAVWRAWIDTTWVTNWFDPDRSPVRLMLVAIMLVSLVMSAALPEAFGQRGLVFAGAYVALQIGRTGFVVAALGTNTSLRRNFQRILAWFVASGVFWLAGGLAGDRTRELLWMVAVGVDYAAPAMGFFTPGLGRSHTTDWTITGSHLAERCQSFLLIALGESVLVSGATVGAMTWSVARLTALVVEFGGTVALWWIYFYRSAEGGRAMIAATNDPGRLGRSAYTYFHLPMVAGIIVVAVADELTIAHPAARAGPIVAAIIVGGPALFVAGQALFKWTLTGRISISRPVAIVALGVVVPCALIAPLLVLAVLTSLILIGLAAWETRIATRAARADRPPIAEPAPLPRTSEAAT